MALPVSASLIEHFSALEDPRQSWKVVYPLPEVLLVVLCGTRCSATAGMAGAPGNCRSAATLAHRPMLEDRVRSLAMV